MPILSRLSRGSAGHPLHPPFTDATIGMYTLATALAIIGYAGGLGDAAAKGMWLALIGGLIASALAASTGFIDWLGIEPATPAWRTATAHLVAMVSAVALFGLAAWRQWDGYQAGEVSTAALVLTLVGFVVLTVGGWLGGTIVFVHGVRVLGLPDLPARAAVTPGGVEREIAQGGAPGPTTVERGR